MRAPRPGRDTPRAAGRVPARTRVVVTLARAAGSLSRRLSLGEGGTMPGRVAVALLTDPLRQLSQGRSIVLVSGTNGKTTTTGFVTAALATLGPVLTNTDGDNLVAGLASTLARGLGRPFHHAVLEVDEVALPTAVAQLAPEAVLLLNLSRDQLDRNSEVAKHVTRWTTMLRQADQTIIVANADDPLIVATVLAARPDSARVVWVATGSTWQADCPRCPRCGSAWAPRDPAGGWACTGCDFARPAASWANTDGRVLAPDQAPVAADLQLPGRVNVGNAAMAAAAAAVIADVPLAASLAAMRRVANVSGRYLRARVAGIDVRLLLAKNPAGWAEVLDQLTTGDGPVVIAVNARTADGTDPSWLWDVPFERLRGRRVVAAGERAADVAVRLLYAEVEHSIEPDTLSAVGGLGSTACDIAANYTAFTRIRDSILAGHSPLQPA